MGERLRYRVSDIRIVSPQFVEVLAPTEAPALTLVTCYPFRQVGPGPQRFIVRATGLP
jgi:sortase A